jgi:hypothetical protein
LDIIITLLLGLVSLSRWLCCSRLQYRVLILQGGL